MIRDKYNRERCLMVYQVVKNLRYKEALTVREISRIVSQKLGLHQNEFERRAIAGDLRAMVALGFPIVIGHGRHNRMIAWGKLEGSNEYAAGDM